MVIFNSYVSLPEGNQQLGVPQSVATEKVEWSSELMKSGEFQKLFM